MNDISMQSARRTAPVERHTVTYIYHIRHGPQDVAAMNDNSDHVNRTLRPSTLLRPRLELSFANWDHIKSENLKPPRDWARQPIWSLSDTLSKPEIRVVYNVSTYTQPCGCRYTAFERKPSASNVVETLFEFYYADKDLGQPVCGHPLTNN